MASRAGYFSGYAGNDMTHTNENNMQNTSDYQIKIVDVPVPITLSTNPYAPIDDTYEYIKRTHNIYFKDKKIGMVYCYLRKDGTIDPLAIMGYMYGWVSLKMTHTQLRDGGATDSLKDGIQKVINSHLPDLSKTNEQASSRKNKTDFKVRKRAGKHRHTQLQYLYYEVFYKNKYRIGLIMPTVGKREFTYHASVNRPGRGTSPQPGEKVPLIQYDWEALGPKTMKLLGYGSEDGLNKAIQHILQAFNTEMSEISNSDDPDWIKRNLSEDEKLNKSDFKVVRKRERLSPTDNRFVILFYIYYKRKLLGYVAYIENYDGIAIPDAQNNKMFLWLMNRNNNTGGYSNSMSECIANIIKNAKKTRKIKENIINDSKNKKSDFNIIKTNFPLEGPYSKSTDFIIFFDIYYKNKKIGRFSYKTINGTAVPNWFNDKMFTWSASSTWDDHISGHSNSMKECITKIIEIAKKKRKIKENIENNSGFFVKTSKHKVRSKNYTHPVDLTIYTYQLYKDLYYLGSVVYHVHESDKDVIPVDNEYNTPYIWDIGTDLHWDLMVLPTRSKVRGGCNSIKEGFQKIIEIYEYVMNHPDYLNKSPRRHLKDSSTKEY